jgi:putative transposase
MTDVRPWHHRPAHLFSPDTTYMVTAGTLHKEHLFHTPDRLRLLHNALLELADQYDWQLQAWAVFTNHYHWIGVSPTNAASLRRFVSHLHTRAASALNKLDATPGRKIWFEYWDTCLTFKKSYLARLNYVHENAVHHRLVPVADQYEFCSARWFAANAEPTFRKKVQSFRHDHLNVPDDF